MLRAAVVLHNLCHDDDAENQDYHFEFDDDEDYIDREDLVDVDITEEEKEALSEDSEEDNAQLLQHSEGIRNAIKNALFEEYELHGDNYRRRPCSSNEHLVLYQQARHG